MALTNALDGTNLEALTEGEYCDGAGLYLRVSGVGGRSWIVKYQWLKKQEKIGVGPLSRVSLTEAREEAKKVYLQARSGTNPKLLREQKEADTSRRSAPSFKEFATKLCDDIVANNELKGAKSIDKMWRCVNVYMAPLHKLPVDKIGIDEVLTVLRPMWRTKPTAARETRSRLQRILGAAKARKHISRDEPNPARWEDNLEHFLRKDQGNAGKRGKHKSVPYKEMPEFMAELREMTAQSARMLEVCILTCVRTNEIIQMQWSQIDWKKGCWVIPDKVMKNELEADIPLTDTVLAILRKIKEEGWSDKFVFPGLTGGDSTVSTNTMLKLLKEDMERKATVHGFRSSFRTWGQNETTIARDVLEYCLHHIDGDETEQAYARGDVWEKRKAALQQWETFCNSKMPPKIRLVA